MKNWMALLDTIDEGLTSSPPVLLDALPTGLEPLPADLAPRAAATLRRMVEVEATLERDRSEIARELAALSAAKAAATAGSVSSVPRFLDTKA